MSTIVPHLDHLQQFTHPANIQDWQPSIDWGLRQIEPRESIPMITPDTWQEMAQVIKFAKAHNLKILPTGQGTKLHWGGLVGKIDLVVSTQKLNQVIDHAVGDMTVTIEAGIDVAELQTILGKEQQFLPLGPNLTGTVGGTIATGMTGSWRQRYGGVRDLLLGISFLRADGELAKAGGRVVKNVAGYDLMKLFTGSYGTLGLLTQATFRVYPLPEASTTLLCTGDLAGISSTVQTLLNSALTPTSCDLLSPRLAQELGGEKNLGLVVRFQSILPSVQEQSSRLRELATAHSLKVMTFQDTSESSLWQDLAKQIFSTTQNPTLTCKIGIIPSAAPQLLQSLYNLDKSSLGCIHASSGVGWLNLSPEVISPEILKKVRHQCQDSQGYLSLLAAPTDYKKQLDVWGYDGNALEIMQKLKQQFDPQATLSPQRFVGNI